MYCGRVDVQEKGVGAVGEENLAERNRGGIISVVYATALAQRCRCGTSDHEERAWLWCCLDWTMLRSRKKIPR